MELAAQFNQEITGLNSIEGWLIVTLKDGAVEYIPDELLILEQTLPN